MTESSGRGIRRIGSYTTARVELGRVSRVERHVSRLVRDAKRLGLPPPAPREVEGLFWKTAQTEFSNADGIIRIEWSQELRQNEAAPSPPELTATTRSIGNLPSRWRAGIAETPHPGPEARKNTKAINVSAYAAGREEIERAGVEEMLLFDADGYLVEGCRSNILVVQKSGTLITPDISLGGVEGVGLEIVRESRAELELGRIDRESLANASEIMAVNAVRGVVPIIEIDGRPVGIGNGKEKADGSRGESEREPVAQSLAALFGRATIA